MLYAETRANVRHLSADVFWFGVLAGSTMAFLAIFAARQGATGFEISLLTAGPAVINLFFSLQAGRWLEGKPLIRITYIASLLTRLGYLVLIPLPWFLAARQQVEAVIWLTVLISLPGTLFAIAFNAMFADIVPPDMRGQVVGRRNALLALSTTLASLLCGVVLDWIAFPLNYQLVFGLGALGAMMSTYHLSRLRLPPEPPVRVGKLIQDLARPGILRFPDGLRSSVGLRFLTRAGDKPLLQMDILRTPFGLLIAGYLFFYIAQYMGVPIYPIFFVRGLNLTDGQISLGTALFYGTMLLTSIRLGPISDRLGFRVVLVSGAVCYGLYPLLIAIDGLATYLLGSLVGGISWALAYGGLVNRLMERTPENKRPFHMSFHNLALNFGILGGSLLGSLLADWVGLRPSLWVVAGLRVLAGLILALWA